MAERRKGMNSIHVSVPPEYLKVFKEYAESKGISISAFLVEAGTERLRKNRGPWKDKIDRLEFYRDEKVDLLTREKFESLTREEKWGLIERLR